MSYMQDIDRLVNMYVHVMGMPYLEAIEKAYTELDKQHEQEITTKRKKTNYGRSINRR